MKVSSAPLTGFVSFTVSIVVESEKEAQRLFAIFNHVDNVDLIGAKEAIEIKQSIGKEFYVSNMIDQKGRLFYRQHTNCEEQNA